MSEGGVANVVAGGWSLNWAATLQGGQPFAIPCPTSTTAGTTCRAIVTGDPYAGPHNVTQFLNPGAFNQPCVLGAATAAPTRYVPLPRPAPIRRAPPQPAGPRLPLLHFPLSHHYHPS